MQALWGEPEGVAYDCAYAQLNPSFRMSSCMGGMSAGMYRNVC